MSNLTSNQPAADAAAMDRENDRMTSAKERYEVPMRRGSKYTDVLLQRLQSEVFKLNQPAVIGVASFAPGQGVTTTALNLGIRAADHRISPTVVIDGDFRDQRVSRIYRTGNKGLTECLTGQSTVKESAKMTKVENLSVLGLGDVKIARQLVIATPPTVNFFDELRSSYRLSIIDMPSIREPSLADAFLSHLDGVLIVARYGSRKEKLKSLQEHIRDSGGKIVGSVMTGTESKLPAWLGRFF